MVKNMPIVGAVQWLRLPSHRDGVRLAEKKHPRHGILLNDRLGVRLPPDTRGINWELKQWICSMTALENRSARLTRDCTISCSS